MKGKLTRFNITETMVVIGLFCVILTVVVVFIYLYAKNHHNEYDSGGAHKTIGVINVSSHPSTVTAGTKTVSLSPGESTRLSIAQHDTVKARIHFFDDTFYEDHLQVSNPLTHTIYVSNSGLKSNISGNENVELVNLADYSVSFVERGLGGRRWEMCTLPAYGRIEGIFVSKNSTWEVVRPDSPDSPISDITVSGIPRALIFNGVDLRAV